MIGRLNVTVLADNYVAAPNLLGEHGRSLLIEADGRRILFDTGQGSVLRRQADALRISFSRLDAVVLSHGHFDHTGGLSDLLRDFSPLTVYLHPAAVLPKYAKTGSPPHRFIGMPEASRQALLAIQGRIVWTEAATELAGRLVYGGNSTDAGQRTQRIGLLPGRRMQPTGPAWRRPGPLPPDYERARCHRRVRSCWCSEHIGSRGGTVRPPRADGPQVGGAEADGKESSTYVR